MSAGTRKGASSTTGAQATPEKHPERRPERKERRGLSHVGGVVEVHAGSGGLGSLLEHALDVAPGEERTMAHMHGFHSYPARLHPETAERLIEGLSKPGDRVLDPFCGSGTVLLAALCLGRRAFGTDLNPLAIELSWLKTLKTSAAFREELSEAAHAVAEQAEARRLEKAGPSRRYGRADRELFPIHVLLELDGLSGGIAALDDEKLRRVLGLVLSSILTKVSYRPGDSTGRVAPRRLAGGVTIRLFEEKARELVRRLEELSERLPSSARAPRLSVEDARRPSPMRAGSADLIVTSPPYAGVFDYFDHHADRLRWLELPSGRFSADEMGSRRALTRADPERALGAFRHDFLAFLEQAARVLAPQGMLALVVADSVVGGRPFFAERSVRELAERTGLYAVGGASQERPYFHAPTARAFERRTRREHLLLFKKRPPPRAKARTAGRPPPAAGRARSARRP